MSFYERLERRAKALNDIMWGSDDETESE